MGNHSVLGKTRRRQDQPLTCGVGGVGRLHIYSMADSIRVIKGRTCNLFYGLICIIFRVSLTIKCKCSLHSHMCMGKLKCCTSPPSDSWGRVSPSPPVRGWRRLMTFQTIECFHSRGQHLCKFIRTKESICIRKKFNSHRTGLGHQHGRRFIVLGHQYGRHDVM